MPAFSIQLTWIREYNQCRQHTYAAFENSIIFFFIQTAQRKKSPNFCESEGQNQRNIARGHTQEVFSSSLH